MTTDKPKEILWHHLPLDKVFDEVKSSDKGLSQEEAKKRLEKYGLNELPKKKRLPKLGILFSQFKSVLVYILLIAGFISLAMGERVDSYVIFFAVLINVVVGYVQENKAQNELEKLRQIVVPKARIIRAGIQEEIEAKYLAPGDILVLEAGDKVTADARIISCKELEVNEAVLTGESAPINKEATDLEKGVVLAERRNMVYQGAQVTRGRAKAVIIATALETQIGKIASLLKETEDRATPLQKKLNTFSKHLGMTILVLSFFILILGLISGRDFITMFNTAVAVAVSAIPEGLAVAVTVILAIGMRNILKKQALVRKLVAAETLGSTTVICTDKTGTITEGEMRVTQIVTDSYNIDVSLNPSQAAAAGIKEVWQLLKISMLCNDAVIQNEDKELRNWQIIGSSTEKALLLAGAQIGIKRKDLEKENPRLDEIVFQSDRKYMMTLNKFDGKQNLVLVKGAPEIILESSGQVLIGEKPVKIYSDKRKELQNKYEALSKNGLRTLAFAYKPVSSNTKELDNMPDVLTDLIMVGFVGIKDPLRADVKETLEAIKRAGLQSVIITGDNKITAKAIASELGIETNDKTILDGEQMLKMNDQELTEKVKDIKIYARVMPKDKLRIVHAWQKRGAVVAMTGDGINDAPALKKADIGIALGSGTEVAKETADLVLLNDSFSTIVAAIEQGRIIYDNIKKVILYLLSDCFTEVIVVFGSLFFGLPLPLLPTQILWVNLVDDTAPALALTIDPEEKEVMNEPPQEKEKPILDFERRLLIGVISFVTASFILAAFYYFWYIFNNLELARTVSFTILGLSTLLYVFSCRSLRHSIFHHQFFQNKHLISAVFLGIIMQLAAIYLPPLQHVFKTVPLGWNEWTIVLGACACIIIIIELIKWIFIARHKHS
ncbi:HAD-IC family P-type ATPase [Patescibacteria group bacterium]|nr:HAD-IC family P-type ATPase [Patescibacteria group bacterium]